MSRFTSHFRMQNEDVKEYVEKYMLCEFDLFDESSQLSVSEIGDGNINYVFRVIDKVSNNSMIIKQADVLLRSSARPLDTIRNQIEANYLTYQSKYIKRLLPRVYKVDDKMCLIAMEDISDHKNLRSELLKGNTFAKFSDDISTFMVQSLLRSTDLVLSAFEKKDLVKEFINKELCDISEDLVFTEPFIDYKGRNVLYKDNIEFVRYEIYDDKKLILEAGKLKNNFKNNAQALLHGDLHSGSIFVTEHSTKVIDPEFAFYGPMGYDLGNVIGNLFFAWANAYVKEDSIKSERFMEWISETIEDVFDLFKSKFIELYKEIVVDPMAKNEDYMNWYLSTILSDAAGSAGLEIIRRVVGDSKVDDITLIVDSEKRVKAERLLILSAKKMIIERDRFIYGIDFTDAFKKCM